MVFAEFVMAWRLAIWPINRSPFSVKATTDGVVRPPSLLGTICVTPPSRIATQELVVPRSIPITLPIRLLLLPCQSEKVPGVLIRVWGAGSRLSDGGSCLGTSTRKQG